MSNKTQSELMKKDIKSLLAEIFVAVLAGEALILIAQAVADSIIQTIPQPEVETKWFLLIICFCILFRWAFGGSIQLLREDLSFLAWLRDVFFIGLEFFLILLFPMIIDWLKDGHWKLYLIFFLGLDLIWVIIIGGRKAVLIFLDRESKKFLYQKIPTGWFVINLFLIILIYFYQNLFFIMICFVISLFLDVFYTYYIFYKAKM